MALGFGFNKAKTLSAAEKYVQQGKLQNAIAEYDKVAKQDPKDLTVLNTIGDLYARLGRADQATENFKKVGDAYAADGFVVKAIAMYKKLTKLNPSALDSVVRLAELYTQQGLYNDARAQYTAVADQYLKNNEREKATGILKKMLDLDPENAAMQSKVADLYLKLGKNNEAREIYFNSAQSLYQRGALDNAEEALQRVLNLDATFAPALLLRGQIAVESGNAAKAIENLSKLPDLDKRPEALRPLLEAYVQTENFEQADPIAAKLLEVHNDLSAISLYADALFAANKPEQAMSVYERNADKLLSSKQTFIEWLTASEVKARENAPAMQILLSLMQRAGATGAAVREVQEQLAHAFVQSGDLQKAADLYRELAQAEPENPQHDQNYRQIIARMGKDSVTRELSVEEGGQALMVDELEAAPAVVQEYSRELTEAINSALTDSELFSSYNVPEKAIFPLERVLPKAPNDVRMRQRLASLYARVERYAEAAACCTVLAEVHASAGLSDQALQYREMATKYGEQAARRAPAREMAVAAAPASEAPAMESPAVAEFSVETPADSQASVAEFDLSGVSAEALTDTQPPAMTSPAPVETEHANEWEDMLTVEEPVAEAAAAESTTQFIGEGQLEEISAEETPEEILEEARFYLSQDMKVEAQSAISRLERVAPHHAELAALRSAAGIGEAAPAPEAEVINSGALIDVEQAVEPAAEGQVVEFDLQTAEQAIDASVAAPEFDIAATAPASAAEIPVEAPRAFESESVAVEAAEEVAQPEEAPSVTEAASEAMPITRADGAEFADADVLGDLGGEEAEEVAMDELMPEVATAEPDSFTAPRVEIPPTVPAAPPAVAAPAMSASQSSIADNPLADMVSDIEEVLGDLAPPPPSKSAAPVAKPMAAAAVQQPASAPTAIPVPAAQVDQVEANSMLSGLLDEFKEGIEEPAEEAEDPDTHYNLGVAFREMGLLDEAIGELQKVCRALDSGKAFSQPIQAYTWLAQCLVDKGAAQAAIRWYERALQVSGISEDSRLAVYYDMANAFESAGNKKAALDNFMQVYGANIDYRDVAERIRSLRK